MGFGPVFGSLLCFTAALVSAEDEDEHRMATTAFGRALAPAR